MLRCAGCGVLVSEWAPRCARCGRGVEDAQEIVEDGAEDIDEADDVEEEGEPTPPEPSPSVAPNGVEVGPARGAKRRWVVLVAAVVAVGGSIGAWQGLRGSTPLEESLDQRGLVLSVNPGGTLMFSQPFGSHEFQFPNLGTFAIYEGQALAAAPDGRYLISGNGRLFSVSGENIGPVAVPFAIPRDAAPADPDPFADGDRALVVVSRSPDSPVGAEVTVEPWTGGPQVTVAAQADEVAGDPRTVGAFVSVPALAQPGAGEPMTADTSVELVDAGRPATVVATASALNQELGLPRGEPVHLSVFPDSTGDKVAVMVSPLSETSSDGGIVVLTRAGRSIGIVRPDEGPALQTRPGWSPDGTRLAFFTVGSAGGEIVIASAQGRLEMRSSPDPSASVAYCLWSPDGAAVLCPTDAGDDIGNGGIWIVGDAHGGPLLESASGGVPLAWVAQRS